MMGEAIALHAEDIRLEDYPYDSKTTGLRSWRRPLVLDEETGMSVSVQWHPAGDSGRWHTHRCGHGMYVISGVLDTNFGRFGAGSFVWFEPGVTMRHGAPADSEVVYLFITDRAFDIDYLDPQPTETEDLPRHGIACSGVTLLRPGDMTLAYRDDDASHRYGRRTLFEGGPTGMEVKLQHFEPGCMTTWHTHHCAHGAWVLGGKYHTSLGDFGPGSFVWFPEGMRMEHGTTDEPCDLIFITNKEFDITFE